MKVVLGNCTRQNDIGLAALSNVVGRKNGCSLSNVIF